jgi:hypothetical protein
VNAGACSLATAARQRAGKPDDRAIVAVLRLGEIRRHAPGHPAIARDEQPAAGDEDRAGVMW